MKVLRFIGCAALLLWMAFVTWRVELAYQQSWRTEHMAAMACGYQFALYEQQNLEVGEPLPEHPQDCAWVDIVDRHQGY